MKGQPQGLPSIIFQDSISICYLYFSSDSSPEALLSSVLSSFRSPELLQRPPGVI